MEPAATAPSTTLVPRPLVRNLAIGVGAVGVVLTPATWADGGPYRGLLTCAVAVVTVVLPLWALWWTWGRAIVVHPDRVVAWRGEREVRTFPFAGLTEVRPGLDGSSGAATHEFWNKSVLLLGRTSAGRRRGLKVTARTVESIDPLVLALAPVVAARPGLLPRDADSTRFAEYLDDARSGRDHQRG